MARLEEFDMYDAARRLFRRLGASMKGGRGDERRDVDTTGVRRGAAVCGTAPTVWWVKKPKFVRACRGHVVEESASRVTSWAAHLGKYLPGRQGDDEGGGHLSGRPTGGKVRSTYRYVRALK